MRFAHRALDPRAKLAFVGSVTILAVAIPRLASLVALFFALALVVAAGKGLGLGEWIARLSPLAVLVVIILVLNSFFYGGGEVLWRAPIVPLALTVGGIETSVLIVARLVVVASAASWFSTTTDPEEFEVALVSLGIPWAFAFVLSLTLRLVPEMRRRFRTIEEAQRSRGLRMEGGPLSRARARIPMFVPFLASVVEYGYELSEALVVRDFGYSTERTYLVRLDHGPVDYAFYLLSVVLFAAFVGAFVLTP